VAPALPSPIASAPAGGRCSPPTHLSTANVKLAVVGTGAGGSISAALLAGAGHEVWAIDPAARTVGLVAPITATITALVKAKAAGV